MLNELPLISESSRRSDAWLPVNESSVSLWCEGSGVEERVTVDFRESLNNLEKGRENQFKPRSS